MKLHIKNQLNGKHIIEFCCGQMEYTLEPEEEVTIEVNDEDCMYFDIVRKNKWFLLPLFFFQNIHVK